MKTVRWFACMLLFTVFPIAVPAFAAGPASDDDPPQRSSPPDAQANDLYSLDLQSLLNMKVTTASKFSQRLSDAPGVMSVVTRDELNRFGGMTLGEILDRVPGLSMTTASFTDRSMVAARGDQTKTNGGHILFLINGRPSREVLEGGIITDLLQSFPVNILERIEVIKGPGSVLYGSNAFSAVVNLITQKAGGNALVLTALGGAGGAVATSGQVMVQHGDLNIVAAGQFQQEPVWFTPVWSTYAGRENSAIPDRGNGAYLGVSYKGLSFMSSFTDSTMSYIEGVVGIARWRRVFTDLGYTFKPRENWDMSFNITYARTMLDAQQYIPFITRDSHEIVLEWSNIVNLTDKDRLTFGALTTHAHGMENFFFGASSTVISEGSRLGEAFYAQMDHDLTNNLKLIGGFQVNKIPNIKLDIVPRAGLIWTPVSHFSVKALYSDAFRAPSINENFLHYVPPPEIGGPSLLGSPTLRPEKVSTIDIGLSYQAKRFQAGVDYFHSKQTDSIILDAIGGHYLNLGRVAFQGVELEGKYYLNKSVFLMGSMLYQANRDGDGNKHVTPVADFGAKAGISYESAKGFTVSLSDVYEGPLPAYPLALNPEPGAYHLLNAHVRFELSKFLHMDAARGLAFVAHANNLANRQVWLPDWKDLPTDSIFANRGRTVYFGIEVSFKKD